MIEPESDVWASYNGAKRCKESKVYAAVDTQNLLSALHVTTAEQDCTLLDALVDVVQ